MKWYEIVWNFACLGFYLGMLCGIFGLFGLMLCLPHVSPLVAVVLGNVAGWGLIAYGIWALDYEDRKREERRWN